jgi:hypothetical protein
MRSLMPYFSYDSPRLSDAYTACIKQDGRLIHRIKDLDGFYKEFGYTEEMRKSGVMPDEFIWDQYIKGNPPPYANCFQMHIVEYLAKNSIAFIEEYGNQYQNWFDDHVKAVTEKNGLCFTCRIKSYCQIGISSSKIPENLRALLRSIIDDDNDI